MTWEQHRLGELVEFKVGKTPSRSNERYWGGAHPWLSIKDMNQGLTISETKEKISDLAVAEARPYLVPTGTVLLSFKLSVGKVGVTARPLFTNEAIAALLPRAGAPIDPRYLLRVLQYVEIAPGGNDAVLGVTLNRAALEAIRIPLPPLPEQRRIAAILDEADALRSTQRRALDDLEELPSAVFHERYGRGPWEGPKLSDVASFVRGVTFKPAQLVPAGSAGSTRFLRTTNVQTRIDLRDVQAFDSTVRVRPDQLLQEGDILVSSANSWHLVGRACLVEELLWAATFGGFVTVLRAQPGYSARFLFRWFSSERVQLTVRSFGRQTTNISNLDIGRTAAMQLPTTTATDRASFEDADVTLMRRRDELSHASAKLDALFASLQHRAFRGQL